ncbi:uncharacterized protein LOC117677376 [Pantherophis guttatus]|uniref:Uncharacterized protein LOC117677376 n=1 Tax=Pantherophis guttatus TaxID=94885 RepID=A0ABM3ZKP6_PANGU|nr:uncharacterized protein LOC117677376 [Pantherophis guttatus]
MNNVAPCHVGLQREGGESGITLNIDFFTDSQSSKSIQIESLFLNELLCLPRITSQTTEGNFGNNPSKKSQKEIQVYRRVSSSNGAAHAPRGSRRRAAGRGRAGQATFMAGIMARLGLKPGLLEHLRKQKGVYTLWATSVAIGGVWLTDWKVIFGYIPWINGKFKDDE